VAFVAEMELLKALVIATETLRTSVEFVVEITLLVLDA
jgi:hypothetical protein